MTKEDAAEALNALKLEYRDEDRASDIFKEMRDSGLVAVFGASDDLTEFRGALNDEGGSSTVYFTRAGLLTNECDSDDCPHFKRMQKAAMSLTPIWDRGDISWQYETEIPHSTFTIWEDGDRYCIGIVFALADVGENV